MEGEVHFEDVKQIFILISKIAYATGIYSLFGLLICMFKRNYKVLKHTSIMIVVLPGILLALAMTDFDKYFIMFHHLAFSNTYWIFDPVKDPVIMILPQEFFMHSFLLIIALILAIAFVLSILYKLIKN